MAWWLTITIVLLGVAWANIAHGVPLTESGEYAGTFWTLINLRGEVLPVIDGLDADALPAAICNAATPSNHGQMLHGQG